MILPTTEAQSWVWNLISCCLTLMCLWDVRNSIHAYLITGDQLSPNTFCEFIIILTHISRQSGVADISKVSFSESESTDNTSHLKDCFILYNTLVAF